MADTDETMVDIPAVGDDDASIVGRVLEGDQDAMAEMYDRYADRINTMCVHMMRDEDEGADICGEVFLTAFQRLHQLRDPAKLRPWLYAVARNEVYRRTRDRSRVRPMEEVDEMQALSMDPTAFESAGPDATLEQPSADPARLAALVQAAAGGLDDRDRMVLELNLTEGLDGEDLADALGVKVDNAYQMTHRMKERLERSMSALLVVSSGREQCSDLDGVAKQWDGTYDVLWRKRFARHVDRCDRCQKMKAKLPKAMLAGVALSQAAQSAVLAAPISIREQVLSQGPSVVGTAAKAWSASGFPPSPRKPRRLWRYVLACALGLIVVFGLAEGLDDGVLERIDDTGTPEVSTPPGSTPTTLPPTTTPGTGLPTTVPGTVASTTTPGTPSTTIPSATTTTPGTTTSLPPDETTTTRPTTTRPTTTTTTAKGTDDPPRSNRATRR